MTWIRAIRVHQWAKNSLLFLPALAAHLTPTVDLAGALVAGFLAFSFLASATYLLNDVVDRERDRRHPVKSQRPVAAREISVSAALGLAGVLTLAVILLSLTLPVRFLWILGTYLGLSISYSIWLKSELGLDVILLTILYAVRLVGGAVLVDVPLSRWFLAFSVFFFGSLALLKRAVEFQDLTGDEAESRGRGYRPSDLPVLRSFGVGLAALSALVYCLYITGSEVHQLYEHPDLLWMGLLLLVYWLFRLWVLAERREVHEDPVIFALRDGPSYALAAGFLAVVWLAA